MMEIKAKWNNSEVYGLLWYTLSSKHKSSISFLENTTINWLQLAKMSQAHISSSHLQKKQTINSLENLIPGHKMLFAFLETWAWDVCAVGSFSTWWPVETLDFHKFAMSSHHHLIENVFIFIVKGLKVYFY